MSLFTLGSTSFRFQGDSKGHWRLLFTLWTEYSRIMSNYRKAIPMARMQKKAQVQMHMEKRDMPHSREDDSNASWKSRVFCMFILGRAEIWQ
jgi:hypothetical protein